MNTQKLQFGWVLEFPKYLSVLTNKEGLVAVVSEYTNFGDTQSLLITLSETTAEVATTPHYINALTISTDKKIKITTAAFYEQQMIEFEKMNSDSKILE